MSNSLATDGLLGATNSLVLNAMGGSSSDMSGPASCEGGDALDLMLRLVASSETVQSVFGVGSAALVLPMLEKFQICDEPDDESLELESIHPSPRAVVDPIETVYSRAGPGEMTRTGVTALAFAIPVPDEFLADPQTDPTAIVQSKFLSRQEWMMNTIGGIIEDLSTNSGGDLGGSPLATLSSLRVSRGPGEQDDDEPDGFCGFVLEAEWF